VIDIVSGGSLKQRLG